MNDIIMPVTVGGVTFKNPFYVASGPTTKNVRQLLRIEETGWAAASIKLTIDPAPYINRKPRYAMFNRYNALAFTAEKRLAFAEGLKLVEDAKKKLTDLLLFANITYAGDDDDDARGWVNMAKKFEEAGADIIELNMCCPNMSYNVQLTTGDRDAIEKQTGASLGQQPQVVAEIVREIKKAVGIPLFVKLTPEGGQIAQVARVLYEAGADAVGGTANRLGIPPIDIDRPERAVYHLQDEISMSCYSGPWLKPLALRDTYEMRKVNGPDPVIMATGGVADWKDAIDMFLCGADLIGVCAQTLISGYDIVRPMLRGVQDYMDAHGYKHPSEFKGKVVPEVKTAPEVTLYGGYAEITQPNLSAPCKAACPHHVPAQAYVQKVARGDLAGAFETLSAKGPLQTFCAELCESPCESACVRGRADAPVQIRALKRYILDDARRNGRKPDYKIAPTCGKKAAVVGSGAAGLSAAFELARAGWAVTVLDRETAFGGSLRFETPRYRMETAVVDEVLDALGDMGVQFAGGKTLGADVTVEDLKADYDAVILAIGSGARIPCAVKNDGAVGLIDLHEFNREAQKGRATAAGKTALVVGDGASAADAARSALRLGVKEVVLVTAKRGVKSSAFAAARREGVRVVEGAALREFTGDGAAVSGAVFTHADLPDSSFTVNAELVLYDFPCRADAAAALPLAVENGRIAADGQGGTALAGVYAAQDHTLIGAIAAGARAAAAADVAARGGAACVPAPEKAPAVKAEDVLRRSGYIEPERPVNLALSADGFKSAERLLTAQEAVEEAARCLNCGCGEGCQRCKTICCDFAPEITATDRLEIDREACVACGMCYNRCPNQNIRMVCTGEKV